MAIAIPVASTATGGQWLMPASGSLGRLYISWRGGEPRHLSTLRKFHSGISTATGENFGIDGTISVVHGWGIAALAKVACRQIGLGPAYLATVRLAATVLRYEMLLWPLLSISWYASGVLTELAGVAYACRTARACVHS